MKKYILIAAFILSNLLLVVACMWDKDTLEMEKQEFPSVLELLSGNFLRHSPEFHLWRIKDREQKIGQYPDSLNLYDDLAVSYSKIENNKKAVELMLQKESKKAGLYETYANLGTFYLHDGQMQNGIRYIDKAIQINPNAHFGREVYQRHLAQYIQSQMENGTFQLPMDSSADRFRRRGSNFYSFLLDKYKAKLDSAARRNTYMLPKSELQKAVKGILGMMRFGNYDSPVLLEALGDVLCYDDSEHGA